MKTEYRNQKRKEKTGPVESMIKKCLKTQDIEKLNHFLKSKLNNYK